MSFSMLNSTPKSKTHHAKGRHGVPDAHRHGDDQGDGADDGSTQKRHSVVLAGTPREAPFVATDNLD